MFILFTAILLIDSVLRYETEGSKFIEQNRDALKSGPNNVMEMWSDYVHGMDVAGSLFNPQLTMCTAQIDEDSPGDLAIDTTDDGYPILPDNTMELQLDVKKQLLRRFVGITRSWSFNTLCWRI